MHALIVASAPGPLPAGLIAQLARDADLVVAADGGTHAARRDGVVPDAVVGDLDSISAETLEWAASAGAKVVSYPADKDRTDLDLALDYARASGAGSVTVAGVHGGRLDHLLAVVGSLLAALDLDPCLVTPHETGAFASADGRRTVTVEGDGRVFSVVTLSETAIVTVSGARWPLEDHTLARLSSHGVSNTVQGERASVHVSDGVVLVLSLAG